MPLTSIIFNLSSPLVEEFILRRSTHCRAHTPNQLNWSDTHSSLGGKDCCTRAEHQRALTLTCWGKGARGGACWRTWPKWLRGTRQFPHTGAPRSIPFASTGPGVGGIRHRGAQRETLCVRRAVHLGSGGVAALARANHGVVAGRREPIANAKGANAKGVADFVLAQPTPRQRPTLPPPPTTTTHTYLPSSSHGRTGPDAAPGFAQCSRSTKVRETALVGLPSINPLPRPASNARMLCGDQVGGSLFRAGREVAAAAVSGGAPWRRSAAPPPLVLSSAAPQIWPATPPPLPSSLLPFLPPFPPSACAPHPQCARGRAGGVKERRPTK